MGQKYLSPLTAFLYHDIRITSNKILQQLVVTINLDPSIYFIEKNFGILFDIILQLFRFQSLTS